MLRISDKQATAKTKWLCIFALPILTLVSATLSTNLARAQSPDEHLGEFLSESGLSGLHLEQLLWDLELETNALRRQQLAAELCAAIKESDFHRAAKQSWPELNLIRRVLSPFPELNDDGLRLSLLKGDVFLRFDDLTSVWRKSLIPAEAIEQIRELERMQDEASIIKQQIENRVRESPLITSSQPSPNSEDRIAIEQMLYETTFLDCWLALCLSIGNPENSRTWSEQTMTIGRQLFGLVDNSMTAFIEQKKLSSRGERQIVLAMALASTCLGRQSDAQGLWGMLADQSVSQGLEDEITVWRFRSEVFYQQNSSLADWFTPEQFEKTSVGARLALSREALLVAEGMARSSQELSRQLTNAAVLQLMTDDFWTEIQNQETQIRKLLSGEDWKIGWLDSGLLYFRFRSNGDRRLLSQSWELMSAMVPSRVPDDLPAPFRRALWLLAIKIHFDAGSFSEAKSLADSYLIMPVSAGQRLGREQAVLIRAQALVSLAKENQGLVAEANAAIDQFAREFPESLFFRQIELERFRLMRTTLNAAEAILWLERWVDNGGKGWQGEFALLQELAIRCNEIGSQDAEFATRLGKSFLSRQQKFVKDQQVPADARLKAFSLLQRLVLSRPELRDASGFDQLTLHIQQLRSELSPGNPAVSESYLLELEMSEKRGDNQRAIEIANWVLKKITDNKSRKSALIVLAKDIEQRLSADEQKVPATLNEAIDIYEQLLGLYTDPEISTDQNAQFASLALVRHLIRVGEVKRADEALEPLAKVLPDEPQVLLLRGDIQLEQGRHSEAVEYFKRVAFGVPAGSELWLQAKWGQVSCLKSLDPPMANNVARQVLELVPNLETEWRSRFEGERD